MVWRLLEQPYKESIAIKGHDSNAKPVQTILKWISNGKGKSHSLHEFSLYHENIDDFKKLCNLQEHHIYPNVLLKDFL
jgi:hypothetical protein